MGAFPSVSKPDFELALKIYGEGPDRFRASDIASRFGVSRSRVYKAVSVLNYLGLVEKKRLGRSVTYILKRGNEITKALLDDDFSREVLRLVFNGLRSRKSIVERISGGTPRNISSVVAFSRLLGLMRDGRSYRLSERGELAVFMWYLLKVYRELSGATGIVKIPELRAALGKYLVVSRAKFDRLLVEAWKKDPRVTLGRVPSNDPRVISEAIELSDGYYYYFSFEEGKG